EHQDGPAATALVLQHDRHDVVLERDRLSHVHHFTGTRALVGRDEVPDALSRHGARRQSSVAKKRAGAPSVPAILKNGAANATRCRGDAPRFVRPSMITTPAPRITRCIAKSSDEKSGSRAQY